MGKSIFESMMPQPVQQEPMLQPMSGAAQFTNPVQKMQYFMRAMTNPAAFMKEQYPDIPDEIANDPNRIMQYLQQTRGISNEQIQQEMNRMPNFRR